MGRHERQVVLKTIDESEKVSELYVKKDTLTVRNNFHKKYSVNKYGWHNWVFDQYLFRENTRVLELGCGTGNTWIGNEKRIPPNVNIILTDISPLMSGKAIRNLEKNKNFSFQLADIQKIPFADNEFDTVIANHMLYHVPNLSRALSEIKRVLKEDGLFYSTTTGKNSLGELNDIYKKFRDRAEFAFSENISYTLDNGESILKEYFKKIEKRLYEDSLEVTEADDLMEYIVSYNDLPDDICSEIREIIKTRISENGSFRINKEQGMFVCNK